MTEQNSGHNPDRKTGNQIENAAQLCTFLQARGLLSGDQINEMAAKIKSLHDPIRHKQLFQVVSALGAMLAMLSFFNFMLALDIIDFRDVTVQGIFGGIFVGLAWWLKKQQKSGAGFLNLLGQQSGLIFLILGKLCMLAALFKVTAGNTFANYGQNYYGALLLFFITVPSWRIFRAGIDMLLSVAAFLGLITMGSQQFLTHYDLSLNWLYVLFLVQYGLAAYMIYHYRRLKDLWPVLYALVLSLMGFAVYVMAHAQFETMEAINTYLFTITMMLGLAFTAYQIAARYSVQRRPVMILTYGLIVLLGFLNIAAIYVAITLMLVGHALRQRLMAWLGILLLPLSLFIYYYSVDVTLLQKSLLLISSGAVLLGVWAYLSQQTYGGRDHA